MLPALPEETIQEFKAGLRGDLLQPGDPGYDVARKVFNVMIDRRPALIAQCAGSADVIAAANFAREHELRVAVRGGGHTSPATPYATAASSSTSRA